MVALHDVGFNQLQISKQLNIFRCCVQNAINKYKYLDTYEDSERPEKVDAQDLQHLKRSDLNAGLPKSVTTQIVRTN